jgi:hypothetical protein
LKHLDIENHRAHDLMTKKWPVTPDKAIFNESMTK